MKLAVKILVALLPVMLATACERQSAIKAPSSSRKAQVTGKHDGTLVGPGYLKVGNVQVVVQNSKIFVTGVNYGSIPKEAITRLHVDDSGGFEVWVNDERRHPDKRQKAQNQMRRMPSSKL